MKDLKIRALSGFLYVALIVLALFQGPLLFYIVLALFSILSLIEFHRLLTFSPLFSSIALIGLFYGQYQAYFETNTLWTLASLAIICSFLLSYRLFYPFQINSLLKKFIFSLGYMLLSCFFIVVLCGNREANNPYLLLYVYSLIWVNNSAAYFVGSQFGKHPLLPTVSPKKSWEGFWGGQFFCFLLAGIYGVASKALTPTLLFILSFIIPTLATIGDLIQSQFKRHAGVKDSGSLLPGHGGFYDRMDSIIFTAPFVYLAVEIIAYVS